LASLGRLPASRLRPPRSGLERSDFVPWPEAADPECPLFRRYRRESRRDADIAERAFVTHSGPRCGCQRALHQTALRLLDHFISDGEQRRTPRGFRILWLIANSSMFVEPERRKSRKSTLLYLHVSQMLSKTRKS
jgi:hypothetical protein